MKNKKRHSESVTTSSTEPVRVIRRFFGNISLDPTRLGRDADQVAEEIVQHLNALLDAEVEVILEINAKIPNGIPDTTTRIVNENCKTMKFRQYSFEEE